MYKNMKRGQKAARIGLDSETDIIKLINTDEQFKNSIKRCLKAFGFDLQRDIKAYKNGVKTDIFIDNNVKIGISVKTSSKTSFHSLDRRWLRKWKEILSIPDDLFKIMKEAILRVAQNSRDYFILKEDERKVKNFFMENITDIVNEIFIRGEKELKFLMINDKIKFRICLCKMKDVINFLVQNIQNNISFSPKGIVKLGNFITVQRKGGNGFRITIPKTDWNHPGNQLQFKFSPLKFIEYVEDSKAIKMYTIHLT